jgi:aerobic carbon-monoxide dehydrogenase large subunit
MRHVGARVLRREDPALLSGRTRYTADLVAGTLAVAFVRSPMPRGVIRSIDRPEDGWVFTAEDLSGVGSIEPLLHRPDYVSVPQPVLATGRVSYVGEPVAVVIAPTRQEAEDLAELVYVDIDDEDPVVGIDRALETPGIHPGTSGNVVVDGRIDVGDVDAAFAAAREVVEFGIISHRQSALPLEARGASATFDPADGRVTLHASTQMPHVLRTAVADLLGMPEAKLRVVAPAVGGGFGQKMALPSEYVVLVWLALRLQRSVSWIEDRRENFMASFHSRDQRYEIRAAFDESARLTALEGDLLADVGAFSCYPVTWGVEPLMAMAELPGPYDMANYRVRSRGVTTNTCPMCPYRGVSRPVLTLAMERLMDIAARRFGIDPLEIRRRNLVQSFPHRSPTGLIYDEGSYVAAMDMAAEAVGIEAFRERQRSARLEGRYLGIGFSTFSERTGYGTPAFAARSMGITPGYETVEMAMDPSGYVELRIGASPHGQGLATTLSQLVADQLGIEPSDVAVVHGDTDRTPYGWGTFASRSMVICGGATKLAAEAMRDSIAAIAAELLEAAPPDIVLVDGRAVVAGTDRGIAIREVARIAYHQSHKLAPGSKPGLATTGTYDPVGTFSNACHVAIVEVDLETGSVDLERFLVVEDAGVLVNPMIVDGQVAGGVTQGIANALYEEIVYDDWGNILTTSLLDYLPPTVSEVPSIEILHLETITDASITGAKGIGEGGTIGAPAAILNAISDALSPLGVEILEMPATPQRIRAAIRTALEEQT